MWPQQRMQESLQHSVFATVLSLGMSTLKRGLSISVTLLVAMLPYGSAAAQRARVQDDAALP